jgi:NAD(P)-dependent dehydrogenase (short-subunit alcohol dehydrogenase family)
MQTLQNQIAVVAGATRGAGRGIACMLGEAGATVYCTGRSIRGRPASGSRPETIEETAELVTGRGGNGIWVQVDHTDEAQVKGLFERIETETGRLDILVNDVWGGDALTEWGRPFWQLSPEKGFLMLARAVNAHILTSRYGVPLMVRQNTGLIVEITDGDEAFNRHYRGNLFYDLAKISAMRLAYGMACELRDTGITALALTPGFLRSEAMLDHFGVTEENWQDAIKKDPYFAESESPYFIGRAVAALAADADVREKSGQSLSTWDLAKAYGFTDLNGTRPDMGGRMEVGMRAAWDETVAQIRARFERDGLDPEKDHQADFDRLLMRGSLQPGSTKPKWFSRNVQVPELLLQDPGKLADDFYWFYRDARD